MNVETIEERMNDRCDKLWCTTDDDSVYAHVCVACDNFLKPEDVKILPINMLQKNKKKLKPNAVFNRVSDELAECYCADIGHNDDDDWIQELLLSPRACHIEHQDRRKKSGCSVCLCCKRALEASQMPEHAAANNHAFGTPPQCLLELTDVELAMLTPVKSHGYIFSYTGGINKVMKGNLSHHKVDVDSIVRSVMHFDVLDLHNNAVVLLCGKMTPEQRLKARKHSKVRPNKILKAMEWLLDNHEHWKNLDIDLDEVRNNLKNPTLMDRSDEDTPEEGQASNSNIESRETFEVFFPDGTVDDVSGGQGNMEKFRELVKTATENGFDIEMRSNLFKQSVKDCENDNLVNACLLQFPHGRGGMHERRFKPDGSLTKNTDCKDCVANASMISQPHFHKQLFSLILHNMHVKQNVTRTASHRTRGTLSANDTATNLTPQNLARAMGSKNERRTGTGGNLLSAIDAAARAVPHTNQATKNARKEGETCQHYFGIASYFLTVTPDDDNNCVVQILSGKIIDDNTSMETLTDEELTKRAKLRTEIRLKFPGLCAFFFELVMDIVIEEVIGWNSHEQQAKTCGGLFGHPQAFIASAEEQGRKTLHGHIQSWIKNCNENREKSHSGNTREEDAAEDRITEELDRIATCRSIGDKSKTKRAESVFPHQCTTSRKQTYPQVADDQTLRDLRSKAGSMERGEMFAFCPDCTCSWTAPKLAESCLIHDKKVPGLQSFPDTNAKRLKAMCIEHQKDPQRNGIAGHIPNAAHNHHIHTRSCFPQNENYQTKRKNSNDTQNAKRKRSSDSCECRHRFPRRKKPKTTIEDVLDEPVKWHTWDGQFEERHIKEASIERHEHDAFQNVSCPAISESKLTCDTNVSPLMPGPAAGYSFKYLMKNTQEDDTKACTEVLDVIQRVLSKPKIDNTERQEATRRLLAASFAHQKTNVISAPMASCITRNERRFIFSHRTDWCPLRDLRTLM